MCPYMVPSDTCRRAIVECDRRDDKRNRVLNGAGIRTNVVVLCADHRTLFEDDGNGIYECYYGD